MKCKQCGYEDVPAGARFCPRCDHPLYVMGDLDYTRLVTERTEGFVGREWVFRAVDDWLADRWGARVFLVAGGPGTGKTAIAAQLVRMAQGKAPADDYSHLGAGSVRFYQFCQAFHNDRLDPLRFTKQLCLNLASADPRFAQALTQVGVRDPEIHIHQDVGSVATGGTVAGILGLELHVGNLSARVAFDRVVAGPLKQISREGPTDGILVLLDALDEALTYPGETLVDLLGHVLDHPEDLPSQIRFLLTSRPDERVTGVLGQAALDLIADAPADVDDVRTYAYRRLGALDEPRRSDLAGRIARASEGNFLYARYVIDDLTADLDEVQEPAALRLPQDLHDVYRQFLRRELGRSLDTWDDDYAPLLGVLAVARGDGLTSAQLAGVTKQRRTKMRRLLRTCGQYLSGRQPDGPFQIYHQSFRDFLLEDSTYRVFPEESNQDIADFYRETYARRWGECDIYGLHHLPAHMAEAEQHDRLTELLLDFCWLEAKHSRLGIEALLSDYEHIATLPVGVGDALPGRREAVADLDNNLRQAAHVLDRKPDQLAAQLLGRLERGNVWIDTLCYFARERAPRPCVLPISASLRQSGDLVRVLTGHTSGVSGVGITRDQRIVSSAHDGTVRIWELPTGREVCSFPAHEERVNAACLMQDDRLLVTASSDGTLRVWDLARLDGGQELHTLRGHTGPVQALAVTSDGRFVVSASADSTLKVWDLGSGQELRTLRGHEGGVNGVAVTAHDRWVVSASSDWTLKVWDLESGRELHTLPRHTSAINAVAATPDGSLVVFVSDDNLVRVWDLVDGHEVFALEGHSYEIRSIALTPDGLLAVTGAGSISGGDNTMKLWDIQTGALRHTFWGHAEPIEAIAVSPDSRFVVSASWDRNVRLWELASLSEKVEVPISTGSTYWINGLAADPDEQFVVSASRNELKVWSILEGAERRILASRVQGGDAYIRSVALAREGQLAVSGSSDGAVQVWDVERGEEQQRFRGHDERVYSVVVTPDDQRVISASEDRTLKVWDLASGEELKTLTGHSGAVYAVTVTRDGRFAVSGSADRTLKVWDLATYEEVLALESHRDAVYAVAVADGDHVVSASWDRTLKVWDLASGRNTGTLQGHEGRVLGVAVTRDGRRVMSAGQDHMLKVWDVASEQCMATFHADGPLRACVWLSGSGLIATGGTSGRVHILRLEGFD